MEVWLKFKKYTLYIVWYYIIAWKTAAWEMCGHLVFQGDDVKTNQKEGFSVTRVTYYHGPPLAKHSLQPIPLTDSVAGNVIYIYNWRGFLRQPFFSFDSAVSCYRHFYSVRAFSSTQPHWLRVYIHISLHEVENFARQFSSWPVSPTTLLCAVLCDISIFLRLQLTAPSVMRISFGTEKRHPPKYNIYIRKTENNSTFATWKCIRCTIIIISPQRVYVYTYTQ